MSKGIAAFVVILAAIMSISVLAGIGYFDAWGVDYGGTNADADVQAAADALTNPEATDTGGTALVEFTTGPANALQAASAVVGNTSGVIKLLFGLPDVVADTAETFFQIIFFVSFLAFLRGVASFA